MPIFVDGDACPVKDEVYRVARRYAIKVFVVSNALLRVPPDDLVEVVVVRGGFDAVDDWIAEHIGAEDVAITADIPLAERRLRRGRGCWGRRGRRSRRTRSARLWRPAPLGHAAAVRRREWRPGPLRPGGSVAVPREARRDHPRGPPPAEVTWPPIRCAAGSDRTGRVQGTLPSRGVACESDRGAGWVVGDGMVGRPGP